MYIQYVGFNALPDVRTYLFDVLNQEDTRQFSVEVQSEAFRSSCLRVQDGPNICFERLKQELEAETEKLRVEARLCVSATDIQEYLERQPSLKKTFREQVNQRTPAAPLGKAIPMAQEIFALVLQGPTGSLGRLKLDLENQSINVRCLGSLEEALPVLHGTKPPHLVFTDTTLPDGNWADVVNLAVEASKPVNVIVMARLVDVGLYLETMGRGAFDFIVLPLTRPELVHVVRCATDNVIRRREAQA